MSVNWSLYEKRLKIDGDTFKDRQINYIKDAILDDFEDSPSFQSVTINNADRGIQIVDENAITKNPNKKRVLCKPDEDINTGDDILWNSVHWLCTNVDSDKEIYAKGIIEKCNNTLKWQTSIGEIKEYSCLIADKTSVYSDGINTNKFITLGDDQILITIQNNSDTILLEVDKRFMFNHNKNDIYKLSKIQSLVQEGILYLTMTKDQYSANDRLDLNLADYVEKTYTIEILNGAEQTVKYGETLQLNIRVESDGVLVTPTPSLLFETSDGTVCTVDEDGLVLATNDSGSATVTVKLASDNNVYATINIKVSPSSVVNYNYTLTGNVQPDNQILYNQTKTFTAVKYDNLDNIVPTQFLFSVVGDTPIDKYQIIVINDTQCSIKCKGYIYTITLRAMDLDNNQYIDKQITLKSLM